MESIIIIIINFKILDWGKYLDVLLPMDQLPMLVYW